jgi:hypothetical protein
MKYINVIDTTYKGCDISVWEHEDHTATCDVKKPNGELIEGRTMFDDVVSAARWAVEFIDHAGGVQC